MHISIYSLIFILGFGTAHGQFDARFIEGAPKDRFEFIAACDLPSGTLTLDLAESAGNLIFDVTSGGSGVEVFQPIEIVQGEGFLQQVPKVRDGDQSLSLVLAPMDKGATVAFTIDVDDTLGGREITVSGSEIEGGQIRWSEQGTQSTASFGPNARAEFDTAMCGT